MYKRKSVPYFQRRCRWKSCLSLFKSHSTHICCCCCFAPPSLFPLRPFSNLMWCRFQHLTAHYRVFIQLHSSSPHFLVAVSFILLTITFRRRKGVLVQIDDSSSICTGRSEIMHGEKPSSLLIDDRWAILDSSSFIYQFCYPPILKMASPVHNFSAACPINNVF